MKNHSNYFQSKDLRRQTFFFYLFGKFYILHFIRPFTKLSTYFQLKNKLYCLLLLSFIFDFVCMFLICCCRWVGCYKYKHKKKNYKVNEMKIAQEMTSIQKWNELKKAEWLLNGKSTVMLVTKNVLASAYRL